MEAGEKTRLRGDEQIAGAVGLLEWRIQASYEQYVIDNEMLGMVARILEGICVIPETISSEAIKEVGPQENFIGLRHTLDHIRTENYAPRLFDRSTHETWEGRGAKDIREVAREKAREILAVHIPEPLPKETHEELNAIITEAEET